MSYQCTNPGCAIHAARASFDAAGACPMCGRPLGTRIGRAAERKVDDDRIPFPVAYPLAFAHDYALTPTERLNNAVFAAYQALRTTGLLLLSDYLDVETSDLRFDESIRGLRMAHWYEWSMLCRRAVEFWSQSEVRRQRDRATHFPALVAGWRTVGIENWRNSPASEWARLLDGLAGPDGPARNVNEAIWRLRNDRAHRMATHTPDRSAEETQLARVLPLVDAMVGELFASDEFTLVRRFDEEGFYDAPLRVVRLHGPHVTLLFEPEPLDAQWRPSLESTAFAALTRSGVLSVFPLFAQAEDFPQTGDEPVTLVDSVKRQKLVLLGVRSHGESEALFVPLEKALERKRVSMGLGGDETKRWTIAEWSRATAADELSQLRGRKYFPECYVERSDVDDAFQARLRESNTPVLLLGEAGCGKSSMVARLVDDLVHADDAKSAVAGKSRKKKSSGSVLESWSSARGEGDVVLFLTGRAAYSGDAGLSGAELLADVVSRRAGIRSRAFASLSQMCARLDETSRSDIDSARRVWILLDGINEADRFVDVVAAIDEFLPQASKYGWLRVVISCRLGAYRSLERRSQDLVRHGGVFANDRFLAHFVDQLAGGDQPWLVMRPFDVDREVPESFRRRVEAYPDRACPVPFEMLSQELRRLVATPLYLHLLHETFAGISTVRSGLDEAALLNAYLDRLCEDMPGLGETIARTGAYLVDNRTAVVPADVVDAWLDAWRRQLGYVSAERVAKLDPIEELVSASVLLRPSNEGFGADRTLVAFAFSHQKLCEQVIARELVRRVPMGRTLEFADLEVWVAVAVEIPSFAELRGALELIVANAAFGGNTALVVRLLDVDDDALRELLLKSALFALDLSGPQSDGSSGEIHDVLAGIVAKARLGGVARERWLAGSDFARALQSRGQSVRAFALGLARLATFCEDGAAEESAGWAAEAMIVAIASRDLGQRELSSTFLARAIQTMLRVVAAVPDSRKYAQTLATMYGLQHTRATIDGDYALASTSREHERAIHSRLAGVPDDNGEGAESASWRLLEKARVALEMADWECARRYALESLEIKQAAAIGRSLQLSESAWAGVVYTFLSTVEMQAAEFQSSREYAEKAASIWRREFDDSPTDMFYAKQLVSAIHRLSFLAIREKDFDTALDLSREALAIGNSLVFVEPRNQTRVEELAESYLKVARAAVLTGDMRQACAHLAGAIAKYTWLLGRDPEGRNRAVGLAAALRLKGFLAMRVGDTELARKILEEAHTIGVRVAAGASEATRMSRSLALTQELLRELRGDGAGAPRPAYGSEPAEELKRDD